MHATSKGSPYDLTFAYMDEVSIIRYVQTHDHSCSSMYADACDALMHEDV